MALKELTSSNFTFGNKIKINQDAFTGPGLLFAYASWCGACHGVRPRVESLARSARNHTVYAIDADQQEMFGQRANIERFPTFFYVSPQREIQFMESTDPSQLVTQICSTHRQMCGVGVAQTGGGDGEKKSRLAHIASSIEDLRGDIEGVEEDYGIAPELDDLILAIKTGDIATASRLSAYLGGRFRFAEPVFSHVVQSMRDAINTETTISTLGRTLRTDTQTGGDDRSKKAQLLRLATGVRDVEETLSPAQRPILRRIVTLIKNGDINGVENLSLTIGTEGFHFLINEVLESMRRIT
jgi:thiol-disulfide isomerase/thioredoxin